MDKTARSDSRRIAFEVLSRVEQGAYADLALDATLSRAEGLDPRDRGLATELVYGTLRCQGRLDFALAPLSRQPYARLTPAVKRILRLGAYQILHLDRVPERAAVHEAVEMTRALGLGHASGFVNGMLRSLIRNRECLAWPDPDKNPLEHLVDALSLPPWLAGRLLDQLGVGEALAAGASFLTAAPLTLRTNTLRAERDGLCAELFQGANRLEATRFAPEGIRVSGRWDAGEWKEEGRFQIQDEASMLIAHLLSPRPGERILDACAAPGGKTTHLAALTGNRVAIVASDLYPSRLRLVSKGAERLGCQGIRTLARDWRKESTGEMEANFDRILVDAPCSGLGVIRRNPEIRWKRTPEDIEQLAGLQKTILERVAPLVRSGGTLLYSVCTFTPEETDRLIESFLADHPDFRPVDLHPLVPSGWFPLFDAKGFLRTWPHRHDGMDAFFAARLERV